MLASSWSSATLTVDEEDSNSYGVKLKAKPSGTVTVIAQRRATGDQDLAVDGPGTKTSVKLTFTTDNWDTFQSVTVTASEDDDAVDGTAAIGNVASGVQEYASVEADLSATEADSETAGLVWSGDSVIVNDDGTAALFVTEGSTATYRVALATEPTADKVTVAVARTSGDSDLSVSTGASLTFAKADWNTEQTVILTAAEDNSDVAAGSALFVHTASGGDYAEVTGTLSATEADNDAALTLSVSGLIVTEGSTAGYTVVLPVQPTGPVAVAIARSSSGTQDSDLSVSVGATLNFTADNWNTAQPVKLAAAGDHDAADGTAVFVHTATGGGYDSVTANLSATEDDDDSVGLTLSTTALEVSEGSIAGYTIVLDTKPSADVTISVGPLSSGSQDSDLSVSAGASLTFTNRNWSIAQSITLTAAADDSDIVNGTAVFDHSASAGGYAGVTASLTATEIDDDAALVLSVTDLTVTEGSTAEYTVALKAVPTGPVTVSIAETGQQSDSLSVASATSLSFTTDTWNNAQTVTLTATEDTDAGDSTGQFRAHRNRRQL